MRFYDQRLNRRSFIRAVGVTAAGGATLALAGCGDDDDDDSAAPTGTSAPTGTTAPATSSGDSAEKAKNFELVDGWYRGEEVVYYDFGMNSPASGSTVQTAPIWAFITGMDNGGNPIFVDGQHNVVDVVPGDDGYSDLWEVHLVMVPAGYQTDSIRSAEEVLAAGHEVVKPGLFVNCPVVPAGSTLENGEELVQGWYKGEEIFYPDFGANVPGAIPIWVFATGMNADGSPQPVEGQHNIINRLPSDTGYSAFWRVNLVMVDGDYEANDITSADQISSSGYEVTVTGLVVNCPVVEA